MLATVTGHWLRFELLINFILVILSYCVIIIIVIIIVIMFFNKC